MMFKERARSPNKEKVQMSFAVAVRAQREIQGLTQEQLAELAGIHTNYVSSVERGERNIGLYNLVRLAFALDMDVSALVEPLDLLR